MCLLAWRACVLMCLLVWRACMLKCLACLCALRAWPACVIVVLGVLTCLACLRACVLDEPVGVRACYNEMFYFLTCLHTCCAFSSYLVYISIFKFKNSYCEKFVCFVKLNIFLIIRNQFKESRKGNLYIHLLH